MKLLLCDPRDRLRVWFVNRPVPPSHEPLLEQRVQTPLTRPAGTLSPRRTRGEGWGERCAFGFMAGEQVRKEQGAFHEPAVERSVHAAGTFASLGRLGCSSRIRWVGPSSSLKAALQNLCNSRPSRRRPPEGGVPPAVHGEEKGAARMPRWMAFPEHSSAGQDPDTSDRSSDDARDAGWGQPSVAASEGGISAARPKAFTCLKTLRARWSRGWKPRSLAGW